MLHIGGCAPRCSPGSMRGIMAASSSCASRTPIVSAPPTKPCADSRWHGVGWTRCRRGAVFSDPALRALPGGHRADARQRAPPIAATAPRKNSSRCAPSRAARKEKPRYDGRCRERTESRAGVAPVIRFKNPLDGEVVVDDQVHGRVVFQNRELDDLIIAALRRHAHLQFLRRGRRHGHGHHARDPRRRSSEQYAAADEHAAGAWAPRRRSTPTCR